MAKHLICAIVNKGLNFNISLFLDTRFGGWTVGESDSEPRVKAFFHNKGWHASSSFYNGASNMKLRAMLKQTGANWEDVQGYGEDQLL